MMKIIFGLGNPGLRYRDSRHNMGFRVIDLLAERWGVDLNEKRFKVVFGGTDRFREKTGSRVLLVKPMTFMNISGEAVKSLMGWYKVALENILIVYDDYNLPLNKIRIRQKGSSGGHRGLKSVIDFLKVDTFSRLRLGIGKPGDSDSAGYVLGNFSEDEYREVENMISRACEVVESFLEEGIRVAMNRFNEKVKSDM